jgi:YegS/Rv2252/BmrU family lipid kinase
VPRNLALIVNPSAGGGRAAKVLQSAARILNGRDCDFTVELTADIPHAQELAVSACQQGRVAVAIGGDGLVGAVAAGCAESGGVLGIVPGGRGNDLARVLGIPTGTQEAVALLFEGEEQPMDLGDANGKPFCCIASLGYDSDANRIANETWVPGSLAYLWAALKALVSWSPAKFRLDLDGAELEFSGFSVIAANSAAYGGGMFIAPEADVHDGLLDVVVIKESSKLRFLGNLPSVFKGEHLKQETVELRRGKVLKINADRPFTIYADGDPICDLPATVSIRPDAIRVILPRQA